MVSKGGKAKIKNKKTPRPSSLTFEEAKQSKRASHNRTTSTARRERDLLMATSASEEVKNIPAEELLELG
jgi:hypothetical protein